MYGQVDQSQTQRKKLIIVSIIMGIIILVLAAVLIDGIMKKNAKVADLGEVTNDPAELEENNNSEPSHGEVENAEDANLSPVSNAEDGSSSVAGTTTSSAESSETETASGTASEIASTAANLPQTGPREVLSLALLLGSVITFLGSIAYLKDLA